MKQKLMALLDGIAVDLSRRWQRKRSRRLLDRANNRRGAMKTVSVDEEELKRCGDVPISMIWCCRRTAT